MNVLILMHVAQEGPGLIEDCLRGLGIPFEIRNLGAGAPLPKLDDYTHIVMLGGPMNVYEEDRYPFLGREDLFIKEALQRGKSVLGICLGAQLMAKALGARVFRAPVKEIGWFEVSLTSQGLADPFFAGFPKTFPVFQWHGDTFDVPKGAQLLATSPAVLHQVFRYGEGAYGLQFHLEVTEGMVRQWMEGYEEEFAAGSVPLYTKDQILKETPGKVDSCLLWGRKFFCRFLGKDIPSSVRHG